jgi:hypothetical protein
MDVIGFLGVSLGSSTAHLHDSLGRRSVFACSKAVSVVKMATILEGCTTEEQRSVVSFCGQKDSMQRIFIKKCFRFVLGSVYRVKRFTTRWQTFRWWRKGWNGGAKAAETTVKRLLCCGFRHTGKALGKLYQCWWRICREINAFFSGFEYHMFYVLHPFVSYLLTTSYLTEEPV